MENGLCVPEEIDSEDFFDNYLESENVALEVHKLCKRCPVRIQCLNYGVQTKSMGIWGGRWLQNGKTVKKKELIINDYFWRG